MRRDASTICVMSSTRCDGTGFVEAVQVMRKTELKNLTKKFKAFMSEFRGVDPKSLTDQRA
jgi:hypothetical protein